MNLPNTEQKNFQCASQKGILAIDQGTTSTRAILFEPSGVQIAQHQISLPQYFPDNGWVEHDPEEIWSATLTCCREAVRKSGLTFKDVIAIGISNQRETTILWDKSTSKVLANAIVWQDRRTEKFCHQLVEQNLEVMVSEKTGLLIDPYFSATKIHWLLENIPQAKKKAIAGEIAFGTIDSFLLWRLTGAKKHLTDASNASRTMLFNLVTQQWDPQLLNLFDIPVSMLPDVQDNAAFFGVTEKSLFGYEIPILAMAGDQQAAAFGQACFEAGAIKSTYGTGLFVLMNTGSTIIRSTNRLLATLAYRLNGQVSYGLEGSIFVAGAAVQWLKDTLHLIEKAQDCEPMAKSLSDNGGVYLVPAFTGLGAPYWDPHARGAILGLTRDSRVEHIVRAALEAVCYQTRDLIEAMKKDGAPTPKMIKVDGGMTANHWLMQFLADIIATPIELTSTAETSALGAAYLAAIQANLTSKEEITKNWVCQQTFTPEMPTKLRETYYQSWLAAIAKIVGHA